jgi:hypothetical protein
MRINREINRFFPPGPHIPRPCFDLDHSTAFNFNSLFALFLLLDPLLALALAHISQSLECFLEIVSQPQATSVRAHLVFPNLLQSSGLVLVI